MRRTDLLDTSIEMHRLYVQMLRKKSPSDKLKKTLELCEGLRSIRENTTQYRTKLGGQ